MQVIGLKGTETLVAEIAARATRHAVREWASRVLTRHLKRHRELLNELKREVDVVKAAKADGHPPEVVGRIAAAFRAGDEIFVPSRTALEAFRANAMETMDFMEALPNDDRRIKRIERLSWLDAEKLSENWHKALRRAKTKNSDLMAGVRVLHRFDNGFFIAELGTPTALINEGDAMGHCVGGYWNRVRGGDTRIVSLRNPDGAPHVTIELARPQAYAVEGRETPLRLLAPPKVGVNQVISPDLEWYACQIRGKQNRPPVDKHGQLVREWLALSGTPSSEMRVPIKGRHTLYVTKSPSGKAFLTEDADKAFEMASAYVRKHLGRLAVSLRQIDDDCGINAIMACVEADDPVAAFAREVVEAQAVRLSQGKGPLDMTQMRYALHRQGVEPFIQAAAAGRTNADVYRNMIAVETIKAETDVPVAVARLAPGLEARRHVLPASGLAFVSHNYGGLEAERVLDDLCPHLARLIADMEAHPHAYHVVRAAGLGSDVVKQAAFACGLGPDLLAAMERVSTCTNAAVKAARLELKRMRAAGKTSEAVNLAVNLLADGYEDRLPGLAAIAFNYPASGVIVAGPEKPSQAAMQVKADPVVRKYAAPRRA